MRRRKESVCFMAMEEEDSVTQCRLWLPKHLLNGLHKQRLALVGWANEGVKSLDMVVVAGVPISEDSSEDEYIRKLQRVLDLAESKLQEKLRTKRKLCVVGEYCYRDDADAEYNSANVKADGAQAESDCVQRKQSASAACDHCTQCLARRIQHRGKVWAFLTGQIAGGKDLRFCWVPNLLCVVRDNLCVTLSTHIIVYNQPQFGSHHFSGLPWTFPYEITNVRKSGSQHNQLVKRPIWLSTMEHRQEGMNMEIIMMELNCGAFLDQSVKDRPSLLGSKRANAVHSPHCGVNLFKPIAVLITVWATVLYCLARVLTSILSVWPPAMPFVRVLIQNSMLLQIMHIRCQQLMAWPFTLLWGGLGPKQPSVATAHKAALAKHSTWISLLIDKIAGAIIGYLVLKHHSSICLFLVNAGQSLTNDILRTGCVWLMGVPAGFKINTELAAVVGTLSLHWIQTWSTLLFTFIPAIGALLCILGLSGVVLGFTVLAAMISDMISLATIHVLSLHYAIAYIYSTQLRALAALCRLFSVEQLLVGSLMFTPLLLLLPTTSVFYTFFSIIFLTVSFVQLSLHNMISFLLSFPFFLVAAWFFHPKQFPSGVCLRKLSIAPPCKHPSSVPPLSRETADIPNSKATREGRQKATLFTMLEVQTASFGELLKPFLESHYFGQQWPSAVTLLYKVFSGERFKRRLQFGDFAPLPHTALSVNCFAKLCYTATCG